MEVRNNKFGKFFGTSLTYSGYAFIIAGLLMVSTSVMALLLIIPGFFIAFTYYGTIIDAENKRVKPYISLFGFIRTGKWIETVKFSNFVIEKSTRKFTAYSRANIALESRITEINLAITNNDGKVKVVLNKHKSFEDAQKEKEELSKALFIANENPG
jgi:hypothetical protein